MVTLLVLAAIFSFRDSGKYMLSFFIYFNSLDLIYQVITYYYIADNTFLCSPCGCTFSSYGSLTHHEAIGHTQVLSSDNIGKKFAIFILVMGVIGYVLFAM